MPSAHYALSEALIVIAALWTGWRFASAGAWLGAIGVAIFGIAAAIGTYRFGASRIEELAALHQQFSQVGGATAMALVAVQLGLASLNSSNGSMMVAAIAFASGTLIACLAWPGLTTPLFVGWLLVSIAFATSWPASHLRQRLMRGGMVAIFLLNLVFVRRSSALGPDLSWHLFHALIALWIVAICWIALGASKDAKDRSEAAPIVSR